MRLGDIVKPTRVLIVDLPGMLRELVREAISGEADIEVVGEIAADVSLPEAIEREEAEVVIVEAHNPGLAGFGPTSLTGTRAPRLLAVDAHGRESFLYILRPVRIALGELSPTQLLTAIRSEAGTRSDRD